MRYPELTLEEYGRLVSEYHLTGEMPPRLLGLVISISCAVTGTVAKRVRNEYGKHFQRPEQDECEQVIRCKLVTILSDRSKATACYGHPERWLYRIAQNEAKEFTGRFLSDHERALAFELRDISSPGSLAFARETEDRLQLETFLRQLCKGLREERAQRFKTTVRMLYAGATQADVAAFFGVTQPNVSHWMKQIRERAVRLIRERKGQVSLLALLLPLLYGN